MIDQGKSINTTGPVDLIQFMPDEGVGGWNTGDILGYGHDRWMVVSVDRHNHNISVQRVIND